MLRTCAVATIIELLLPLRESTYWLTKVELLQTLGCLYFTDLALTDPDLPQTVLEGVVFMLLGDTDHRYATHCIAYRRCNVSFRVRCAACDCLVCMAPTLQLSGGEPLLASAQWHASQLFSHLHSSTTQLSLAGIADSMAKLRPLAPMGLEYMLWFLLGNVGFVYPPRVMLMLCTHAFRRKVCGLLTSPVRGRVYS